MNYPPCRNPNCKSYGKPHPNCKCYGQMAQGGEVKPYCSTSRAHQQGCAYFAEGGDVAPDFIPDDSPEEISSPAEDVTAPAPVQQEPAPKAAPPDFIPDESEPITKTAEAPPDFIPDEAPPFEQDLTPASKEDHDAYIHKLTDQEMQEGINRFAHADTMALSVGPVFGIAAKAAAPIIEAANLGKVGAGALKGLIEGGLLQGTDEASKAILGQGDPHEATSPYLSVGAMALFSGLLGAGGAKIADVGARAIGEKGVEMGAKAENWLAGLGHAASGGEALPGSTREFANGFKAFSELSKEVAGSIGSQVPILGKLGGPYVAGKIGEHLIDPIIGPVIRKTGKYFVPTVARWLSEGAQGSLFNMIEYADKVAKGTSAINNTVDMLFKGGSQRAFEATTPKNIEKLRDFIDGGGMDQSVQQGLHDQVGGEVQGFAEGGEAKKVPNSDIHAPDAHLAQTLPEQNHIIQTAKGRVSGYLSAMRPQKDAPRLPFDDPPDDREEKKKYERALHVAAAPLGVLHHINSGTVEPDDIKHLSSMYPELTSHLQKKVTERIVKAQIDGEKPSYKVRQGLSMFMGTPLSGEMTPQNIQAAQAVFATKRQQQQANDKPPANKAKNSSSLTKSDRAFLTDDQARIQRQQKV